MGVSVTEQIKRLAEVDLGKEQAKERAVAQQRLMVLAVDRRLVKWAEWTIRAKAGEEGFIGSVTGALVSGGGVGGSTDPNANGMPDDIYDTDRAVLALSDVLQEVVRMEYFKPQLLQVQRASKLGMSERTYRRKLRDAQQRVVFYLKPPAKRLKQRRIEKCAPRGVDTHDRSEVRFT